MANIPPPSALPSFISPVAKNKKIELLSEDVCRPCVPVNPVLPDQVKNLSLSTQITPQITSSLANQFQRVHKNENLAKLEKLSPQSISDDVILKSSICQPESVSLPSAADVSVPSNSNNQQKENENETCESKHSESWMGWFQSVSSKVAEKAKTSMDTMITTSDPQMTEFINSGGDIEIFVTTDKSDKIYPIKTAFQKVFGKATVSGLSCQPEKMANQPVGFDSALKCAESRINVIRASHQIHPQQPVIAVEGFITTFSQDQWVEMSLLLLDDPYHDIILQCYTQPILLPLMYIEKLKKSTRDDYEFKSEGFEETIGHIISQELKVSHTNWHENIAGVSRSDLILMASKTLATMYKNELPTDVI